MIACKVKVVKNSSKETGTINRSISIADWCLLLSASVLVGSTFLFVNIAVKEISPLVVAALRAIISAAICWGVMRAYGVRLPRTRQGWKPFLLLGLLTSAIPFGTVAWGQQHIESGMGGILFGTMPILAVVLAPMFLAEEIFTRRALIGGVVGFAGIVLLMGLAVLANAGGQILGIVITFLGPVCHTLGAMRSRLAPLFFPVVAVTLGTAVLGERLPIEAFVGLALILAGAFAVSTRVASGSGDSSAASASPNPQRRQATGA